MRTIGILGGMGPQATVLLQQRLIDAVAATDDADHIPLLVDMNPQVPSRLQWILEGTGEDPGAVLAQMARRLEAAGAEALAMPCNTAHHFAPAIRAAAAIPLLHMVDLARDRAAALVGAGGRVGILASPATERTGLFRDSLAPAGLTVMHPDDSAALVRAIRSIKAGDDLHEARTILAAAAADCTARGADCLLVACSEFSMIADAARGGVAVIDTLDLLVQAVVEFAGAAAAAPAQA